MEIPNWLNGKLKPEDVVRIEDSIRSAESKTSAEIVPAIINCSSSGGHVYWFVTLFLFTILSTLVGLIEIYTEHHVDLLIVGVLSFLLVIGSHWFAKMGWVYRLFVLESDRDYQTNLRAVAEFHRLDVDGTSSKTGVLVFVSLRDHRAVVLADAAISTKFPPETWHHVVELVVKGIAEKNLAAGLCQAIDHCGDLLSPHFPITANDKNEIRNQLVIIQS